MSESAWWLVGFCLGGLVGGAIGAIAYGAWLTQRIDAALREVLGRKP